MTPCVCVPGRADVKTKHILESRLQAETTNKSLNQHSN